MFAGIMMTMRGSYQEKSKYPTEQLKDIYYQTLIDNEWLLNSGY